jgi:opine dehydrogenase
MAGALILQGIEVRGIYDRFPEMVKPVQDLGGVKLVGDVLQGFAPIKLATTDIGEVVDGADVIMVVVPATAHDFVLTALAPHLRAGQIVVLNPGYLGGAIAARRTFDSHGVPAGVAVAETNTLAYATRLAGPGQVAIRAIKRWFQLSAFPARQTPRVLDAIHEAFPQCEAAASVLETGFNNPNPIAHVPTTLMNYARFESPEAAQVLDFHQWISPGIQRVIDDLDAERQAVAAGYGVRALSLREFDERSYGGAPKRVTAPVGDIPPSARSVPERYVVEDVPMGLVPLVSLGQVVGVPTPIASALIDLAASARGIDYWREGRTLAKLGLSGMKPQDIVAFLQ